ncbi:sigma-70 family RNA polymerase sigma factor [Algoriphagus lacus]|uniref:Sigma-70 family RNA polymerase sigma factor n=1 Tax=Algoriphagus lacus TaxID=2056311 RepID=A0A418PNP6_9BACT|nr:sigma-70 family RNA polymerase sigma factor [Algoriphagus lacus]RIW13447.1 sigma-70 family RNA polymerase sigma factor [Algoriphagus lacus]
MNNESDHLSDKFIVANVLNGKIQDFALIVKGTEKLVTQIVKKMVFDEDDQKDLLQDIYLKAYQNLASFQFKSKLSTWVGNIAYNTTINHLQKKKIPIYDLETASGNASKETENPEVEAIQTEAVDILTVEIANLPPLYQTLITLYHLEELTNKEIAQITNLPEGTIKSYLFRARQILKEKINQHYKRNDEK